MCIIEYSITVENRPGEVVVQKSSVVVGGAVGLVKGAVVEELVYCPFVVVTLLVVFGGNVGNAKLVELGWLAKVGGGVARGGLASVVMLAINVPPEALASLFGGWAAGISPLA